MVNRVYPVDVSKINSDTLSFSLGLRFLEEKFTLETSFHNYYGTTLSVSLSFGNKAMAVSYSFGN